MRSTVFATQLVILLWANVARSGAILDISYQSDGNEVSEYQLLDLYLPDGVDSPPLLMWIHGGAWAVGSRRAEAGLARRLAEVGIAVAAIDHRRSPATWIDPKLSDGVTHPAHVRDCAQAFAWLSAHAGQYGFDENRLYVGGYSSGAHLAALLALDPKYLLEQGLSLETIRGSICVAGAYDLESYYADHRRENGQELADSHVLGVFGTVGALKDASPIQHLDDPSVPLLVISEADTYEYTRVLETRVDELDLDDFEFVHEVCLDHRGLARNLSRSRESEARSRMITFISAAH